MPRWLPLVLCCLGTAAFAGDDPLSDPLGGTDDDDLWKMLEDMPPHRSGDLAIIVTYSDVTYWRAYTPPWMGFGIRGAYGWHVGDKLASRLGMSFMFSEEGPVPEYFSLAFEPSADWDHVDNGILVGASIGPSLLLHSQLELRGAEWSVGFSPAVSARIGWSQPFSRIAKRMFVVANPKLRWVGNRPNWVIGIAVGSGSGK